MISSRGNSNYCRDELRLKTFSNIKSGSVRRRAKKYISQHERLILSGGRPFLPRYAHVVFAPPVELNARNCRENHAFNF